jgi:hypothetical protein
MLYLEHGRITFNSQTVATIEPKLSLGLLRAFEDAFQAGYDAETLAALEADRETECAAEYDRGRVAGVAEQIEAAKSELEESEGRGYNKGFDDGHFQGVADSGKASDAARVGILLKALAEMHDLIQPICNGVKEEGQWKPRTIKIGEAKRAAQSACATARIALHSYRKDK